MKNPLLFLLVCVLLTMPAYAQEMTPRVYWPAPEGTQLVSIGYSHVTGDTTPDPTLPITSVDSDIDTLHLAYLHTISLLGRTANLVLEFPYSDGDTAGEGREGNKENVDYHGVGDVTATLSVNLLGAPTLSREDFAELRRNPHPILGASLKLVAPTGDYDSDRAINVGANRWAMKAELGYIQPLKPQWLFEVEVGAWLFEDNDNFLGKTRKQDPIYALDIHLIRRFSAGFWGSLDASAYKGGRSEFDGNKLDDLQRDAKAGFTLLIPFGQKKNAVKLSYSHGSLNDSNEDFDTYLISYQRLL
jgi:hypothetical protein